MTVLLHLEETQHFLTDAQRQKISIIIALQRLANYIWESGDDGGADNSCGYCKLKGWPSGDHRTKKGGKC